MTRPVETLLHAYLAGEPLSPAGMHELEAWLKASEANRAEFLRLSAVDSVVRDASTTGELARVIASQASARRARWGLRLGVAAAAAAALAIGIALWTLRPSTPSGGIGAVVAQSSVLQTRPPVSLGDRLVIGSSVEMGPGLVELRTVRAASVVIEGPALFRITGENALRLESGRLSARVGPEAVGFAVQTPGLDIVDLGTEFEVDVGDDRTRVDVFEGSVRVGGEILEAGSGVTFERGGLRRTQAPSAPTLGRFPRPAPVASLIDLRPAYLHRFDAATPEHNLLAWGEYPLSVAHGPLRLVDGPELEPGVQNAAAGFEGRGTPIEVVAGATPALTTEAYTLAFWVRLDRAGEQAIVCGASNQGPEQSFNLRISTDASGHLRAVCGLRGQAIDDTGLNTIGDIAGERHKVPSAYVEAVSDTRLPVGQWTQVVVSAASGGELRVMLDGRVAAAEPINGRIEVRHERILLGAFPRTELFGTPAPPLRGAIDEFAMYDRALPAREAAALAGGPQERTR